MRRRRQEKPPVDSEPPEWIWQYRRSDPQWRREGDAGPDNNWCTAEVKARQRWREARDAWLEERALVMSDMRGLRWDEFKRIRREEPHRILRHPDA
ncbi:hypothetical protein [Streptomyces sp. NPDC002685]|uniref:hypothetical protein n=1 Tax=Streptomyces sp. NPDC002685 TaxID=3154540 RepID=UPI003328C3D5